MTVEQVTQKIAQLEAQLEQLKANVHATAGAIAAYREMLDALRVWRPVAVPASSESEPV
jgi:cell division protein FtsB